MGLLPRIRNLNLHLHSQSSERKRRGKKNPSDSNEPRYGLFIHTRGLGRNVSIVLPLFSSTALNREQQAPGQREPRLTQRRILLIATTVSFLPQIHRVARRHEASGISLAYMALLAISALEQAFLYTGHFLFHRRFPNTVVGTPLASRDWLNFAQFWSLVLCTSGL
jgi:uncharacterized protein with PQ loop repeat